MCLFTSLRPPRPCSPMFLPPGDRKARRTRRIPDFARREDFHAPGCIMLYLLARGGNQCRSCIHGRIIEVDLLDEPHCELVVYEVDMFAGVNARAAMFAHPPER